MNTEKGKGLRKNEGKLRMDLVPESAINGIAKVLTFGAEKYAPNNWRLGMPWSKVTSSLKRHLAAIDRGEDFDEESKLMHIDHVLCNAAFLKEYYKIYPQGDDRPHNYLIHNKIGLDIDGVLGDFVGHLCATFGKPEHMPTHWNCPFIRTNFDKVKKDAKFWATIPTLINPEDIPFEPHCYITARSIDAKVTQEWLDSNGFPMAPLYCIGVGESKEEVALKSGVEIFVDDNFENFRCLNAAGVSTYLMDTSYNRYYNVGYKRIKSLKEIV
jgi:hypothetical protein